MRIVLLLAICFVSLESFAVNDGDREVPKNVKAAKTEISYLDQINYSLSNLYDSVNIWWTPVHLVNDSIKSIKIPRYPEYIYSARIMHLNELTPMGLEYNEHVLKYIDAYGVRNRDKLQMIIAKSAYYFPIFEEYLDKYKLPLELKYLAAVESALDATAVSKSGAVGLWQFMKPTSDIFDIKVSSYIDERRDVYKSTDAACRYLKYLYETFGDWQLALAAYNGGPGTVKRAIVRSGGKTNYWELRPYFTDQMQNYVPAFIAMNYLMSYHAEHNIFPNKTFIESNKTDTLIVRGPLYLKNIAAVTGCELELLKDLNPVYTHAYIPMDGNDHTLVLPFNLTHLFLEKKQEIDEYLEPEQDSAKEPPYLIKPKRENTTHYTVEPGDNLFRIAMKYNCSIAEILSWNSLPENYVLRVGDKLKIMIE